MDATDSLAVAVCHYYQEKTREIEKITISDLK